MNWETLYCPNPACRLYGVRWQQSLLVKNGSSRGYKQALCRVCGQSVVLRYGTAYFELEADPAIFDIAIRALAEGNSLRSTARIVQIDKDTALESDQLAEYRTALLHVYGQWYQPARNGDRGRFPARRRAAPPELRYAQVVKQRERGHVVAVTHKIVFGSSTAVQACLAASQASTAINTSFVERENLTLRQHNRRLTRKTSAFSKELSWLERQMCNERIYAFSISRVRPSPRVPARWERMHIPVSSRNVALFSASACANLRLGSPSV